MKSSFASQCGLDDTSRQTATQLLLQQIQDQQLELIRFAWCDMHGMLRSKSLVASAVAAALASGVGMVSTLLLKDSSDRTAYKVFEAGGAADLPGFEFAGNVLLLADPASFKTLPWAEKTGWLRCQPWFQDARPVELDTRRVLQNALARLAEAGFGMKCGLEIEFHIYRIRPGAGDTGLDPQRADWPGPAPEVDMIHPGYQMLSDQWLDLAEEPLRIVQHTAQALGLPLLSLEIEMGPSQVEAVFDATDALTAADNMVLFRNAVRQALRRAGYYATFVCRPPFPHIMSSGWHLHQCLLDLKTGVNAFKRQTPAAGSTALDAQFTLSETGEQYLAGLLAHAPGMTAFSTPTINGYERFRPNALAPQAMVWGRDNRGAMLRVIGSGSNDNASRIENRVGEPAANPYLYIASQIHAGLDGIQRQLKSPAATDSPYNSSAEKLPTSLGVALDALADDPALLQGFGKDFVRCFTQVKKAEIKRHNEASDPQEWQRREYFGRI